MSQPSNFKDNKILKSITIITLLYSVLMIINYLYNFLSYFLKNKSPLLPDCLTEYIAFPIYFILPFLLLIVLVNIFSLRNNDFNFYKTYIVLVLSILFFVFQSSLYLLLMNINPFCK